MYERSHFPQSLSGAIYETCCSYAQSIHAGVVQGQVFVSLWGEVLEFTAEDKAVLRNDFSYVSDTWSRIDGEVDSKYEFDDDHQRNVLVCNFNGTRYEGHYFVRKSDGDELIAFFRFPSNQGNQITDSNIQIFSKRQNGELPQPQKTEKIQLSKTTLAYLLAAAVIVGGIIVTLVDL